MDEGGSEIGFASGRSLGVGLAQNVVAVLRIAIIPGNPAGLNLVGIPATTFLLVLENRGVIQARSDEVDSESIRGCIGACGSARGSEFVLCEILFKSGHDPDAFVPDLLCIPARRIMISAVGPKGKVIREPFPPLKILEVLVLSQHGRRGKCANEQQEDWQSLHGKRSYAF